MKTAWNKANLVGKKFTRLTVISETGRDDKRKVLWLCKCQCGGSATVRSEALRSGNTKSCGCLQRESVIQRNTSHGLSKEPEYKIWSGIIKRCFNKANDAYPNYGGKGITVCAEWKNNFKAFYSDIGKRPSLKHEIERIDNNGNYEPSNCKWATREEQQQNKSTTKIWMVCGIEYNSSRDAAKQHSVTVSTIKNWCDGYISRGKRYPPKTGCNSKFKYEH